MAVSVGLSALTVSGSTVASTTTTTAAPATTTTAAPATTTTAPTTAAPTTAPTTAAPTTAAPTTATSSPSQTTVTAPAATSTTLSSEDRQEKARAVANLNLAKAADVEIATSLKAINDEANTTIEKIEAATKRIEVAEAIAARSEDDLAKSGDKQREIEASLMAKAVEGFKTRSIGGSAGILSEATVNEALRQNQLLDEASSSTTELLEELRGLLEDRRFANAQAEQAAVDATEAEQILQAELETLKEQQNIQVGLKVEAERRIDQWAGELTAYAKEDAAIQTLIGRSAAPAVVNTAINNPTTPSALGFQWPVAASVTSEYGYRIHPVYGSRRLHAGIDVGAAGGTPIASSNNGVVIFAGTQGGYGRTVIVDHGGGITTLYAHMSQIGSTEGQTVARGDILGFVGASGTATGNPLHFEVRVNGGPVNPRNYLP
ncbi:MAG: peptidoglycan DD-metalloendopeptidase family protein [Acidimicrobiales bacterium]